MDVSYRIFTISKVTYNHFLFVIKYDTASIFFLLKMSNLALWKNITLPIFVTEVD